ncbi:hypothetical protein CKO12_09575 [Chromatium okenii]|uniref:Hsp70 family protein n=1 Tax=Chromatium okenii TaxID=61644 RepID=UPI0019074755|nr:Hsp70 family protein [Chromatium okenii]MBK1642121.1 hypothetical protein [Chromatium okenii]
MAVVGFDFGTTNSLIAVIVADRAINALDEEGLPIPSVVCYEGGKTIVGKKAKERRSEAGLGIKGNVVSSPKMFLGQESIYVEGLRLNPIDVVSDVVKYVISQATANQYREIDTITHAVVTIPVDTNGRWRVALRDAFRRVGIGIVQYIHEPLAALYGFLRSQTDVTAALRHYNRELLLVFDWGGGTLDLTLCQLTNGMLVQIRNDGTSEVGGDHFDDLIRNEIVRRVLQDRGLDDTVKIQPDAWIRLLHRCERAKIDLSTRKSVEIYVPCFFPDMTDEDLQFRLTQEILEEITDPLLTKGLNRIRKVLNETDVAPAQIALCLATGGMVNMPAIKSRLHEWFGPQRVEVSEHTSTLIAEGAAWIAHDEVRLQLAKNVELLLARNSYLPVIKAGTAMPGEGDIHSSNFHLYCVDPRDGNAKFQLVSPVRPGINILKNDVRIPLENLVVEVDAKAKLFQERLELDVSINDNLILTAHARSINKCDYDKKEVHDLEFGLTVADSDGGNKTDDTLLKISSRQRGELTIRSNIANRKDSKLVPGELLDEYAPEYFDRRLNPPEYQDRERLYYKPCSICGRASNDPLCQCSSKL